MGVSASVSCAAYEGRTIRLLAEQLRYENGQSYVAWRVFSEGGAGQFYGIGPITAAINGTVVYSKEMSSYYGGNTAPFPVATGSVNGSLWIPHTGNMTITITLDAYVYYDTGAGPYSTALTLSASGSSGGTGGSDYSPTPILFVSGGQVGSKCLVTFAPDWEGYSYLLSCYTESGTLLSRVQSVPRSSGRILEAELPLPYSLAEGMGLSGRAKIGLKTFRGSATSPIGSQVGAEQTYFLDVHVVEDDNTRPQITGAVFSPSPDLLGGTFLQNLTGVRAAITAEGRYGAAIEERLFRVEGREYQEGQVSGLLAQYGSLTVTAFVRDSRGFTSQGHTVTLEALPYSPPRLRPVPGQSRVTAVRCDEEGDPQENGACLILKARREYSPVTVAGIQRNFCSISWRYKPDSGESWSAWQEILPEDAPQDSVVTSPLLGTLDPRTSYQVELRSADTLGGLGLTAITVYSDRIYWHRHGSLGSLGFGKYAEEADVFDVAQDKTVKLRGGLVLLGDARTAVLDLCHPVGSVLETADPGDPGTYLGGQWSRHSQTESTTKWRRIQ